MKCSIANVAPDEQACLPKGNNQHNRSGACNPFPINSHSHSLTHSINKSTSQQINQCLSGGASTRLGGVFICHSYSIYQSKYILLVLFPIFLLRIAAYRLLYLFRQLFPSQEEFQLYLPLLQYRLILHIRQL